jgi:hypothetical protein
MLLEGEIDDNCLRDVWREAVSEQRKRRGEWGAVLKGGGGGVG